MITPLFLYNYSNKKTILLTFLLWAGFIAIHFKTSYIDLRLPQYLIPFSAGIITARSASLYNILKNKYVAGASFIFFLVVLSIYPLENELTQLIVIDVAVLASIPSFIFLGQYLIKILSPGLLWFVAYSSYCLYLFHRLTYSISIIVFQPTGFFPSIIYLGFIILPTTLILCFIIQRCYDVIFQWVKNKF
jgi:peptidoglycan/LPS O-acetylase OafA/YrhL